MSAALLFERVSAGYGDSPVLRSIDVSFAAGKVSGLVGPNGAGKTTLLRTALGLLPLAGGEIRILDRALKDYSRDALARAVAYLPQGADAQWPIDAERLVALGRLPHRASFAPLSREDIAAVGEALARCDASDFARRRIDELSSGERARVLLARALATQAPVLLVDEPAAHLDPAHQLRLMELLREEAARGAAVVVTLHDLTLASRFCDEITVLKRGEIVSAGSAEDALSDMVLAQAFGVAALKPGSGERFPTIPWQRL
jgi:iron complex transport system ATP-binding protein